jgi:exodeoxyribonuclease VII large subunit
MDDLGAVVSNVPEYTVSEIAGAVKQTLEGAFARVRVRGEITELRRYSSGHIYFCLKDQSAKMKAVVWRTTVQRLGTVPVNGVEVVVTGRVSSYVERSEYQLVAERMDYAGAGALLARIEMLRQRLSAEGLFDADRKRAFPRLPDRVGVVTSPQGAVIQDIRITIARRFPRTILLWPVPVQGEGAAAKIAAAIRGFDSLPADGEVARPDVLIVARGGGSLEDLMAFNDEEVVRAVAACRIPVVSAVGHETDTTLIDYVSDRRAPTPTAAAELVVPVRTELLADLQHTSARMWGGIGRSMQERRLRLGRAERGLPDLLAILGGARQRVDDRADRLLLALPNLLAARRAALDRSGRLPAPHQAIAARRARVELVAVGVASGLRHVVSAARIRAGRTIARLTEAPLRAGLREARARLHGTVGRLDAVSPEAVLRRGYALVLDRGGHPVVRAADAMPGARVRLRFVDGEANATIDGGKPAARQGKLPL